MRLTRVLLGALSLLTVALAGCGTPSYTESMRSSISSMAGLIHTYNTSSASSLDGTAMACDKAATSLAGMHNQVLNRTPPPQYRRTVSAVRRAYDDAYAGFRDCVSGARALSYPRMTRAEQEIEQANLWIGRARRFDG